MKRTTRRDLILAQDNNNDKPRTARNADLVLADISGSMADQAFEGKSKYDCLKIALDVVTSNPKVACIGFNSIIHEVSPKELPLPSGGTALHLALQKANSLDPLHVLVVCDGCPDSRESALLQATLVAEGCIIDALYIGPPTDNRAIDFMKELARVGRGRYSAFDPVQNSPLLLTEKVKQMLALTGPSVINL